MRSRWEVLRTGFLQSIQRFEARKVFPVLRGEQIINRFCEAGAVVDYLASRTGDLDEKDAIYAVLVREVQRNGVARDLAWALLWLGLWAGLDALYWKELRYFKSADLASEISLQFVTAVGRASLERITKVAATLVWNTRRNVIDRRPAPLVLMPMEAIDRPNRHRPQMGARPLLGVPPGLSEQAKVSLLRERLREVMPDDADGLVNTVLLGRTHEEMAKELGITPMAARKRSERAMRVLRMSHFSEQDRVFSPEPKRGSGE